MASKIIMLDDRFPTTGEPTIQPVVLWGPRGKPCYESLSKEASASPAIEYIKHVQPVPGRTVVLIIGLGSFEYYGLNRNGDGFNEHPYKPGQSNGPGRDAWIMEDECIQHHYQSYEQGHVFRHHVNKDPRRAVGKVLKAFWNSFMHRVEVLEDLDNNLASDLVQRISDGEYPAKSMGCRIKFDVCTKCGNMAPTRRQYCDHLKFEMNRLDPLTGIRNGALNPKPRFFDSSWVIRPADRCGFMLKKVAEVSSPYELWSSRDLGDYVESLNDKSAAAKKLAVIDKVVRGYPAGIVGGTPEGKLIEQYRDSTLPSLVENTEELSSADLAPLNKYPLADSLEALSGKGILPTTPEFLRLFMAKAAPGHEVPPEVMNRLVSLQSELFELFQQHPSLLADVGEPLFKTSAENPVPGEVLEPMAKQRSLWSDYFRRRLVPQSLRHGDAPKTELMTVTSPRGEQYQTTRGATEAAGDAITNANIKRLAGAGALMAGAYKTYMLPGRAMLLSLPLAGAGAYLGSTGLRDPRLYTTDSGEQIPVTSEMREKTGLFDVVNTLGLEYGLTKQGATRLNRTLAATGVHHPIRALIEKQAHFGLHNPHLSLTMYMDASDKHASDGIKETPLNLEKIADVIGTLAYARL